MASRVKKPSEIFEKLHLVITLSGDMDDLTVAEVVQDTIMHTCPVSAMFRKTAEITGSTIL
jgi:putative redox protein